MNTYLYSQTPSTSSPGGIFLPLIVILLISYFLLLRPQMRKQKALDKKRKQLKKGDQFVTSGGLLAVVSGFKANDTIVVAEISQGVKVEVVKSTILEIISEQEKNDKSNKIKPQKKSK